MPYAAGALITAAALTMFAGTAYAVDCNDLKPIPPTDQDKALTVKIDGEINGLLSKIAGGKINSEGSYRNIASNVLPKFPDANKLYMWERVLYIQCQLVADSTDISNKDKIKIVGALYNKFGSQPPPLNKNGGSEQTISGSCNTGTQGSGNKVNTHSSCK